MKSFVPLKFEDLYQLLYTILFCMFFWVLLSSLFIHFSPAPNHQKLLFKVAQLKLLFLKFLFVITASHCFLSCSEIVFP